MLKFFSRQLFNVGWLLGQQRIGGGGGGVLGQRAAEKHVQHRLRGPLRRHTEVNTK